MRSEAKLDSAVFQLTPTRTRCELVIIANGKTEKIAYGLVIPFLSHLKTAHDQFERGGYSIKLEPDPAVEAAWFTKAIVERFVRFVSTPEVLERVNTIESEILQIEEAISIQGNENLGLSTVEEHHQIKSVGSTEGNKPTFDTDAEKAIILYKPGSHPNPLQSNGFKVHEENSKVQLLKVLENRKKVLQKEQAMAFARAAAAGFDMENMAHLISFAESFGASRLMEACVPYMQLWKGKHETGQWIEVEAAEALSYRSEFSPLNSSGIILSGDATRQKELVEAWPVSSIDSSMESNGNTTTQDNDRDKRFPPELQAPRGPPEYYQGQFQHPAFPQWPMLSQTGPQGFPPYPMPPMPYYQNYPMNGQFFHPPPTPPEDPRYNAHKRKVKKKHSVNRGDSTSASEDGSDESTSESEEESSKSRSSHKKAGHSRKKKGVVVIRNLNYIAGNRHETSGNGSESTHDSEIEENKDSNSSKRKDDHTKSFEILNVHGKDEEIYSQEADTGNWQAFQSFLLKAEEKMSSAVNGDILAGEKEPSVKKTQIKGGPDPILLTERDSSSYFEGSIIENNEIKGNGNRIKHAVSADEFLVSSAGRGLQDSHTAAHFKEIDAGVGGYRKVSSDAFIMYGRDKQMGSRLSSDPLADCEHEHGRNSEKSSSHNVNDESFMVPLRSGSQDLCGTDRRLTIDMESEFPLVPQRDDDSNNLETTRVTYEPDDLTLMLGRARESESVGYDPAIDYDIQVPLVVKHESKKQEEDVLANTNEGLMNTVNKKKLKSPQGELEKKRKDVMTTKMTSSRSTPLSEAQKRAEKLRNYKAELQKLKKEQEEEELRRLEALKRERQKRIATRSGSNVVQSPATPQQHKPRLPIKVSPNTCKNSKFIDSESGSNSPLQKSRNIISIGSNDSDKATKTTRSNGLSRSASSLPEIKKESTKQEGSSASERIRRLSEPKSSVVRGIPAKSAHAIQVMKKPLPDEPQLKKISAIIQLDKTKLETLPELKIKAYGTPSEAVKTKPATKQQKGSGSRCSVISESSHSNVEKTPGFNYVDENPVIEKNVVMLENEVVSPSLVHKSDGKIDSVDKLYRDVKRELPGVDTGYTAIRAPASPIYGVEIENPSEGNQDERNSYEVVNHASKDESEKFFDGTVHEKPYRAPYARASSLEDPAIGNFQYVEAPPVLNIERTMHNVSDLSSIDQMDESQEKPRNKESKGLKKLWKFGRKGHSSGSVDSNVDSNGFVVDHMVATSSSSDTSTLKNLISQDETNAGATQTKVSRPFSILLPFRGRINEKKVAA